MATTGKGDKISQASGECGIDLASKINYVPGASSSIPAMYPSPNAILLAVLPGEHSPTILIRVEDHNTAAQYISYDRGQNWQLCNWRLGYSNIPKRSRYSLLMSHIDQRVLYDCYFQCKDSYRVSTDGGTSWAQVDPTVSDEEKVTEVKPLNTGMHFSARIYAQILDPLRRVFTAAVSDDYGRSFRLLSTQVEWLTESRANNDVLFGILSNNDLAISKDRGLSWMPMLGSKKLRSPIYRNPLLRYIRSWKENADDVEFSSVQDVDQIDSDPKNWEWIYVLTYKGLYISRNAGQTFRLASLAQGRLNSIDDVAVDPMDGRFLYAMVDLGEFYRSTDHGCSWHRMPLPGNRR